MLLEFGLALLLLPLCSFAPGFFLVRRLRWSPLEKLCGSVALSLILVYLAAWGIYCLTPADGAVHVVPYAAVSSLCLLLGAASWKDLRRLVSIRSARHTLAGFALLLLWTALLLALIRVYSGGGWTGDWVEHFQRSLYFLHHFPMETEIAGGYQLPARPPMMNVLASFFLAQTGDRFECFQLVFTFLNLLFFLPCCLIMPALGRRARRRTWLLTLLFAASPVVMENSTYAWTKASTAFFIVLGLWFYLAGWRKRDRLRMTAAFVSLAAGLLAHYSAGPYVAIVTLHYLICVFPRRTRKWRELAGIAISCSLLLATWFAWSIAVFGVQVTLASNTTVTENQQYEGSTATKIAANLFDTIVPAELRQPTQLHFFDQPNPAGRVRDRAFLFYQVNAIFGMGLIGGPLVLWFLYGALRDKARRRAERGFWLLLIPIAVVLGVTAVGQRDHLGLAHATLLSLDVLGVSMLAAVVPWNRRAFRVLVLAGCTVDFSFGVLLQARMESLENSAQRAYYPGVVYAHGEIHFAPVTADSLSGGARKNWYDKHYLAFYQWTRREMEKRYGEDPALQRVLPQIDAVIAREQADDVNNWQGWFARHNGEIRFLGDHTPPLFATSAMALLVILFVGLATAVSRAA